MTYQVPTNIDAWVDERQTCYCNVILPALSGNVESEVIVVLNDVFPNLNTVRPSVSESLRHQNNLVFMMIIISAV